MGLRFDVMLATARLLHAWLNLPDYNGTTPDISGLHWPALRVRVMSPLARSGVSTAAAKDSCLIR